MFSRHRVLQPTTSHLPVTACGSAANMVAKAEAANEHRRHALTVAEKFSHPLRAEEARLQLELSEWRLAGQYLHQIVVEAQAISVDATAITFGRVKRSKVDIANPVSLLNAAGNPIAPKLASNNGSALTGALKRVKKIGESLSDLSIQVLTDEAGIAFVELSYLEHQANEFVSRSGYFHHAVNTKNRAS